VPALAMWISPAFHLKACKILNEYIVKFWKENSDKLMDKCTQMAKEIEDKSKQNDDMASVVEGLLDNVVHKPKNDKLLQTFLLFKLNNPQHKFQFATARCQKRGVVKVKKRIIAKHPEAQVIFEMGYTPNAMNLNNVIKDKLNSDADTKMIGNEIECMNEDVENTVLDNVKNIVSSILVI
jgi:hypothetical protein